jgi:UDP-2,3-diacylglucosamine pyrophosphatase LpxH
MDVPEKFKIVISDCHLSAGHFFENKLNVHEDFYFDREMTDLFEYFSTGDYGEKAYGPVQVELFINGDYFDFLNVPYHGEFEDAITEELSLYKLEAILAGHPEVMQALKKFASLPGKTITYMIGNHDADLFFPKVRERIIRAWDPEGSFPSEKVKIIVDSDRIRYEGGVEIHHGNQFEAIHMLDFKNPILNNGLQILNIPWGSFYVLKIINRMRCEREFIDKIRPAKVFVFFGLIFDPWFTIRFVVLSIYYFLKTHFVHNFKRKSGVRLTLKMLKQETDFLLDLERQARKLLDQEEEVKTIIFGHTHKPMQRVYPDGKQYINTGTWTKMINLDWRNIGQRFCLSFAFIRIHDGGSECQLRQWVGDHAPHQAFRN